MANEAERLRRANHAERLLDDSTLQEALDLMEQRYLQELRDTTMTQEAERNQLWHRWQAVLHFRRELQAMLEDGHLLDLQMEKTRKLELRMTRHG